MFFKWTKKREEINSIQEKDSSESASEQETITNIPNESNDNENSGFPQIKTEILSDDSTIDKSRLVEIRDSKVLTRIDNLIPGFFHAGNAIANAVQTSGGNIYKAIIPAGEKLTQSSNAENAFRGFCQNASGKITGHANFVEVGSKASIVANGAAAAMSVASIVVGQYYMSQINNKLEEISNEISKISDFQDDEFESRVKALLASVKNISDFQIDIVDKNETRQLYRGNLERYGDECIQLLGQACQAINRYTDKMEGLKFDDYEKELLEIQKWFRYQNALISTLNRISELKYTLALGEMSRDQCGATLSLYRKQVEDSQKKLRKWHRQMCEQFGININTMQKKKKGISYLPGIIKKEWRYKSLDEKTSNLIINQTIRRTQICDTTDFFSQDIQLVEKENKLYYILPERTDRGYSLDSRFSVENPYEVDFE